MQRIADTYFLCLKGLLTALLMFLVVPVSLQILTRYTGWLPRYIWTEEVARFCFVWMIMVGSAVAVRESAHFDVDLRPKPKTPADQARARFVVHLTMLLMALIFAWYGWEFASFGASQRSEMTGLNMVFIYAAFPFAGLSWAFFLGEKMWADWQVLSAAEESSKA